MSEKIEDVIEKEEVTTSLPPEEKEEKPADKADDKKDKEEEKKEDVDFRKMFEEFYKEMQGKEKEEPKKEEPKPVEKDPMTEYMEEISKAKLKQLDYHVEKVCMKEEFPDQFKKYIKYDKDTTEKEIESQIEAFNSALKGYAQSIIDEKKSGGVRLQGSSIKGSKGEKTKLDKDNFGAQIAKEIYGGGN